MSLDGTTQLEVGEVRCQEGESRLNSSRITLCMSNLVRFTTLVCEIMSITIRSGSMKMEA